MLEKKVSETIIKIRGGVNTNQLFELGENVSLQVEGSVLYINERDEQDGTKKVYFVIKPVQITRMDEPKDEK